MRHVGGARYRLEHPCIHVTSPAKRPRTFAGDLATKQDCQVKGASDETALCRRIVTRSRCRRQREPYDPGRSRPQAMCLHGPSRLEQIYGRGRLGMVQKAKLGLQPCQATVQPRTRSPPSRWCPRWAMPENSKSVLSVRPCTRASTKQSARKDRARRGGSEIRSPGSPDRSLALIVGRIVCLRRARQTPHRAVRGFATSARLPLKLGPLHRTVSESGLGRTCRRSQTSPHQA